MSMGPKQVFTALVASNTTSSTQIDLGDKGQEVLTVHTGIPGAVVSVFGASVSSGTFSPIYNLLATSTVAFVQLTLPTSTSGVWSTFTAPPFRFITLACTATCTNGNTFTVIAS